MNPILEKIDELRKIIKGKEALKLLSEIRKDIKRGDKIAIKYDHYFTDTLDGMSPEKSAYDLGLL